MAVRLLSMGSLSSFLLIILALLLRATSASTTNLTIPSNVADFQCIPTDIFNLRVGLVQCVFPKSTITILNRIINLETFPVAKHGPRYALRHSISYLLEFSNTDGRTSIQKLRRGHPCPSSSHGAPRLPPFRPKRLGPSSCYQRLRRLLSGSRHGRPVE